MIEDGRAVRLRMATPAQRDQVVHGVIAALATVHSVVYLDSVSAVTEGTAVVIALVHGAAGFIGDVCVHGSRPPFVMWASMIMTPLR